MNWEYDFIVFDIEKGPKIIQEVLNTLLVDFDGLKLDRVCDT